MKTKSFKRSKSKMEKSTRKYISGLNKYRKLWEKMSNEDFVKEYYTSQFFNYYSVYFTVARIKDRESGEKFIKSNYPKYFYDYLTYMQISFIDFVCSWMERCPLQVLKNIYVDGSVNRYGEEIRGAYTSVLSKRIKELPEIENGKEEYDWIMDHIIKKEAKTGWKLFKKTPK